MRQSTQYMVGLLLTTARGLSADTAYLITRTVFESLDAIRRGHPAASKLAVDGMLQANTAPFHPGALRYFKEKGLRH